GVRNVLDQRPAAVREASGELFAVHLVACAAKGDQRDGALLICRWHVPNSSRAPARADPGRPLDAGAADRRVSAAVLAPRGAGQRFFRTVRATRRVMTMAM